MSGRNPVVEELIRQNTVLAKKNNQLINDNAQIRGIAIGNKLEMNRLETEINILWLIILIMMIVAWIRSRRIKAIEKEQEETKQRVRTLENRLFNILLVKKVDKQEKSK